MKHLTLFVAIAGVVALASCTQKQETSITVEHYSLDSFESVELRNADASMVKVNGLDLLSPYRMRYAGEGRLALQDNGHPEGMLTIIDTRRDTVTYHVTKGRGPGEMLTIFQVSVKDGDIFAIPSDLTNGGRALKVLEAAGLIVCDPAKGYVPTKTDIIKYNVKIEIREAESGVLYNILPDVSAALINGGNAYTAGLDAVKDSIFAENINVKENPNVGQLYNVIVARSMDKDNPVYKKVVDAYHTQQTAKTLMDVYKGAFTPVWAGSENYKY